MQVARPKSNQPIPKNAKKVFAGVVFDVYQWQQKMFDGSYKIFEKIKRVDTVHVIPVIDGKLFFAKQKQPGRKTYLSCIGGRVDKGESILKAAKRELLEESGLVAEELNLWHAEQPISKIEFAYYVFIAKGCKKIQKQNLDSGEKIELVSYTFDEFIKLTADENFRSGEISLKIYRTLSDKKMMARYRKMFLG
ncbi:MAG: NUDIX hydrolase [Parcubacteria group bacterium]|jgi:8-oxo-dGTP pyrophosphatase MutT (NUDIX family)